MILPLVALIFVDGIDLCVFSSGSETLEELVVKVERLFNALYLTESYGLVSNSLEDKLVTVF